MACFGRQTFGLVFSGGLRWFAWRTFGPQAVGTCFCVAANSRTQVVLEYSRSAFYRNGMFALLCDGCVYSVVELGGSHQKTNI